MTEGVDLPDRAVRVRVLGDVEASVGDDAECLPTIMTFAEAMSCACPAEVAAVSPDVDTSSADCTLPEFVSAASRVVGSAFLATAAAAAAALVALA